MLCVGAHADDIEIGAGGTISWLAERSRDAVFTFVVLSARGDRGLEASASARDLLGDRVTVHLGEFRDGFLPYDDPSGVKDFLRGATEGVEADLVLGPNRGDLHQDHSFAAGLLGQTFRDHLILGYEIAKFDGDMGAPQAYVAFGDDIAERKTRHLLSHFGSQHDKPWYDRETFLSNMRLRGIESGSDDRYAEAFYATKFRIG